MKLKILLILILACNLPCTAAGISSMYSQIKQEGQPGIPEKIRGLPLVITVSKIDKQDAPVALIISGDGGWRKFEQQIADKLALLGIPTIGLDIKKYFWERKTPEGTTADMVESIKYYMGEWKRSRFILAGYSLGAEVVPFITSRMNEEMRSKLFMMVMLSPSPTTDFEVHVSDMLGVESKHNTLRVIDEIEKTQSVPSLCIFGLEEKSKVPALLKGTNVKVQFIPGDHHYNFDSALIVAMIKKYSPSEIF